LPIWILFAPASFSETEIVTTWKCSNAVSSGISSDEGESLVKLLEGQEIVIEWGSDSGTMTLPNRKTCQVDDEELDIRKDDMATWGSYGGSWSDLGLVADKNGEYQLATYRLACTGNVGPSEMSMQSQQSRLWLDVGGHVWVPCQYVGRVGGLGD
jgi:hypothetical protein